MAKRKEKSQAEKDLMHPALEMKPGRMQLASHLTWMMLSPLQGTSSSKAGIAPPAVQHAESRAPVPGDWEWSPQEFWRAPHVKGRGMGRSRTPQHLTDSIVETQESSAAREVR